MKDELIRNIDTLTPEIIKLTKQLIEIPTENPPGKNYKECVELIRNKSEELNLKTRIIKVETTDDIEYPRYILIATYGKGKKILYFHGHYDVVPAQSQNQFRPYIRNGRIFGRGSADMKGGLSSMIYAVKLLDLLDVNIDGKIILIFVPDEETGGKLGTEYLFKKCILEDAIAMLMPEPSGFEIWNSCRGAISFKVMIKGKSTHVSLQHEGINAFEIMTEISQQLKKLKRKVEKRKTEHSITPEEARNSIMMLGGLLKGGTNFNIVPDNCIFSIDRRFNPEEELNVEKNNIIFILDEYRNRGVKLDYNVIQEGESACVPKGHPVEKDLILSVEQITGKKPAVTLCPGLLEIRYYIKNNIPAFCFGPGKLKKAHSMDESVSISSIKDCAAIYALTAIKLLTNDKMKR